MSTKPQMVSYLIMLFVLFSACKKSVAHTEEPTKVPPNVVYATEINIKSSKEGPILGSNVTFTPIYQNTVDKITWLIDDVNASTIADAKINTDNTLTFAFKADKEYVIKVVAKTDKSEITASHKITAYKKFNVIAFYNGTWDQAHINFVKEANIKFPKLGEEHGFNYTATRDWSKLNEKDLANYQVVLFLDDRAPKNQEAAFQKYMENGGGWMGFHVCAFNTNPNNWDWYYNKFLGVGGFKSNTWGPTTAILRTEDRTHPSTQRLPEKFTSAVSEWYGWTKDLRQNPDIKILCSVHEESFPLGTDPKQSWYNGYYPIIWTNNNYKMLYTNFGHNAMDYGKDIGLSSTFDSEIQNRFIIDGLLWLGRGKVAGK